MSNWKVEYFVHLKVPVGHGYVEAPNATEACERAREMVPDDTETARKLLREHVKGLPTGTVLVGWGNSMVNHKATRED